MLCLRAMGLSSGCVELASAGRVAPGTEMTRLMIIHPEPGGGAGVLRMQQH
jgi:hypothetical protein